MGPEHRIRCVKKRKRFATRCLPLTATLCAQTDLFGGNVYEKLIFTAGAAALLFVLAADSDVFGQGRGGGQPAGAGGGPPAGVGNPGGGPPAGVGVDRGLGTASQRSGGRSDTGLGNASVRSNRRSDDGIARARMADERANSMSDTELNRYRGLSNKLGITPEEMRARYRDALLNDPDLKYGQFVSAYVVADSIGTRFPLVTADWILFGYQNGDSRGQTLQQLGLSKRQGKDAQRLADDKIREARSKRP